MYNNTVLFKTIFETHRGTDVNYYGSDFICWSAILFIVVKVGGYCVALLRKTIGQYIIIQNNET
jgi:hypothetical protein